MTQLRFVWTPYPYRAGFCITDDTDCADFHSVKQMYDLLAKHRIFGTKTVWAFSPSEPCGIPAMHNHTLQGITLEDPAYFEYCQELHRLGFEISLHGASAGNNKREQTIRAFELMDNYFPGSDTFICHSKNADNLYWEEKSTRRFPFKQALNWYCKLQSSGEVQGSPYFWADIASQRINQIRFYRTRQTNTLAVNPSMPYYEETKPMVNGWFSATKKSFASATSEYSLQQLKAENGLCILYHYMHKYVLNKLGVVPPHIIESIERLGSDSEMFIRPVTVMMNRLRQMQGLFLFYRNNRCYMVNTSCSVLEKVQVVVTGAEQLIINNIPVPIHNNLFPAGDLAPSSITVIESSTDFSFDSPNAFRLAEDFCGVFPLQTGSISVNFSESPLDINNYTLPPFSFHLNVRMSGTGLPILSVLPYAEEMKLLYAQFSIIAGEILFKGRKVDSHKLFDNWEDNLLSNQDSW